MLLSQLSFPCLRFLNDIFHRPLSWFFICFSLLGTTLSTGGKISEYVPVLLFFPTFALNRSERNYLWTGNSGYSRLIWNDPLYKIISISHLIDKAVYHMPLKSLVLTTHTLLMAWMVSISFSVWQDGTQFTIDKRCFIPSSCQAHDTFFCLLISCTLLNGI